MPKSEGKHKKTKLKLHQKKEDTKSSYYSLSKLYDKSIVLTAGTRFRSTRVSLFVLRTQRNSSCYGAVVLSKLRLSHKIFTLLLAKSNFHISVFLLVISAYYFQLFTFKFLRKTFQVSVRRFRLSRFSFSSVYCQIPTFRLLLATPIFTLLLCKLLAETTAYFLIVFICVISAQLPHNVPALHAGWGLIN